MFRSLGSLIDNLDDHIVEQGRQSLLQTAALVSIQLIVKGSNSR